MQAPPGSRYARLVRAVLVAVLHPGDGFPVDRIEVLRRTGLELLRTAGGDAEPLGDDGVAAVFDDPAAGLEGARRLVARWPRARKAPPGGRGAAGSDPPTEAGQGELSSPPHHLRHTYSPRQHPESRTAARKSQRVMPPSGKLRLIPSLTRPLDQR